MSTQPLKTLLENVHARRIVLPQFQRDFVWLNPAVMKLMTSLFNGYPIGSLLLMENNGIYDYRVLDGVPASPLNETGIETDLVLDGQQRLTSCYRAFYGTLDESARYPGRYYFDYRKFIRAYESSEIPDGSAIEEYFVFKNAKYVNRHLSSTAAEQQEGLFPLDIIFREVRGANYSYWLSAFTLSEGRGDEEKLQRLNKIASLFQTKFIEKVTGYQVNFEKIIKDTNPDVICTIFETINTTGVKLTVFDLLVAKCFKKHIRLRDKLDEAVEQFHWISKFDPDGNEVAVVQIPRILGMLIRGECKKGIILGLDAEKIGEKWDQAVSALDKALKVLYERYGCYKLEFVPSTDAITPLGVILSNPRFSMEAHGNKLDRWYWSAVFGQYLAGAPESKISKTVREWFGEQGWIENPENFPEAVRDFQFRPSLIDQATKNAAVYKGLLSLMLARKPNDIGIGRKALDAVPPTEIHDHHIFPQKFLHNNGIKGAFANQITNRMPIWKLTNESIFSTSPHVYLRDRDKTHHYVLDEMMSKFHCDPELISSEFSADNYMLFCLDRKEKFVKLISEVVGRSITDMVPREELLA